MKIVIVGNGTTVLNGAYGKFVDSCDRIIRINGFRMRGFAQHVGSRLDIYSGGNHCFERSQGFLQRCSEFWFPFPRPVLPIIEPKLRKHFEKVAKRIPADKRISYMDTRLYDWLGGESLEAEPDALWKTTTGFKTIVMAKRFWPGAEFYFLGFDHLSTGSYWYPDKPYVKLYKNTATARANHEKHAVNFERTQIKACIISGSLIRVD